MHAATDEGTSVDTSTEGPVGVWDRAMYGIRRLAAWSVMLIKYQRQASERLIDYLALRGVPGCNGPGFRR